MKNLILASDSHLASKYTFSTSPNPFKDIFFISAYSALKQIINYAKDYDCDILFAGDWFDSDKVSSPEFAITNILFNLIKKYNINLYLNRGNHETDYTKNIPSVIESIAHNFSNIFVPSVNKQYEVFKWDNFDIVLVPYYKEGVFNEVFKSICDTDIGKTRPAILCIHQNIKGIKLNNATLRDGNTIDELIDKSKSKFDAIVCGHIHHTYRHRNIYIPGSTTAVDFMDLNSPKSFFVLNFKHETSWVQIPIKDQISFIEINKEQIDDYSTFDKCFVKVICHDININDIEKRILEKGAIGVQPEIVIKNDNNMSVYSSQPVFNINEWLDKYLEENNFESEEIKSIMELNNKIFNGK